MAKSIAQKKEKNTTKDGRYRQWTIVVYPESAPENWRELLNGLTWIESPLHDKDTNPDGTQKKPHWHILLAFVNKKSYEQIKEIADSINAASPQYVQNMVGMVRYFAHLDNPEKYQYDKKLIIGHGIDISEYLESSDDLEQIMCDIEDFIDSNKIVEYAQLVRMSRKLREVHPDWHKCITTHTIHFSKYVSSCRHAPDQINDSEEVSKLAESANLD